MPTDRYQQLTALPPGRFIAKRLGLPESRPLRRYEPGQPLLAGPALAGGDGRLGEVVTATLAAAGAEIRQVLPDVEAVKLGALVFDATGLEDSTGL
jgi:3-oxoacyl-[acyl-carrier protein] reductase